MARLQGLRNSGADQRACAAMTQVHRDGRGQPGRIVIRSAFARLARQLDMTVYSDRRVPERHLRPPATRLVHSRGCALQLYLTLLFEAQCRTLPGGSPGLNKRPLKPTSATADEASWVDLVAASTATDRIISGVRSINDRERRVRQIRQALATLAADDVQLLAFADPGARRHYQGFRLLHEGGRRAIGDQVSYAVPRETEPELFGLDARLFTNGWIHVLADTELAFLCMVADLQARNAGDDLVPVPGAVRVGNYCLGTDGYQAHHVLNRLGLIQVRRPRGRRADGTFRGYDPELSGVVGALHRFGLLSDGFARPALRTALRALGGLPDGSSGEATRKPGTNPPATSRAGRS
jgi:hypothetical protein